MYTLEAQVPIYWVPVIGSLYKLILSITQEPTIWVPGLLGYSLRFRFWGFRVQSYDVSIRRLPVGGTHETGLV